MAAAKSDESGARASGDDATMKAWALIWGSCTLMDVWQQPFDWASQGWQIGSGLGAVVSLLFPSPKTLLLAMAIRNGGRLVKAPFIFDSEMWALSCDAAFAIGFLRSCWSGSSHGIPRNAAVIKATAPIVITLLGMFYFGAGFWKVNTSFLDHRLSCGSIFTASLFTQLWPHASWGAPPTYLAELVVKMGPLLTIVGECSAGLVALIPVPGMRMLALVMMILLHAGISFTAYPNGIGNFSYTAATRYFFFLPESASSVLSDLFSVPRSGRGYFGRAVAMALIAVAWHAGSVAGPQHMGTFFFSVMSVLYLFAVPRELTKLREQPQKPWGLGALGWAHVAIMAFPVYGAQILGVLDIGAPASPFSSIRLHGGSNHLLLPTGLLLEWSAGDSILNNSFAGGVVRVEYTDSTHLNYMYPADHTSGLRPEIVDVLRRGGHIGRQFNPTPRRVFGPDFRSQFMPRWSPDDGPFVPYTLPAMELRRIVGEVLSVGEPCTLVYTKLGGFIGDEHWRATAKGPRVEVTFGEKSIQKCTIDGEPCANDEFANMPDIGYWHSKVHVYFPYPILHEAGGELPCMD